MALILSLLAVPPQAGAQDVRGIGGPDAGAFRTDRLSPRQLRIWMAIRKVVLASDAEGRALYPTLCGLWRTVEQSGHQVFIELITDREKSSNMAAECVVENLDPAGRTHAIRVRLYIATIDRAWGGEQAPQDGLEFVPFAGLKHEKRYAKVLGHELTHVANMLRDPDYLRLVQEICLEQRTIAAGRGADGWPLSAEALKERWARIWPLVSQTDKPALAAERQIYRELLAGK